MSERTGEVMHLHRGRTEETLCGRPLAEVETSLRLMYWCSDASERSTCPRCAQIGKDIRQVPR